MAPGLNGRQTGTVPKNKPKNNGSQSHRSPRDPFNQSPSLNWGPVPDSGNKSRTRSRGGTTHSETEIDSLRYDLCRSRSSTMTSQNESGEGCSQDSLTMKMNLPDRKQVVSKLTQIQSYIQQTAALMNALKASDTSSGRSQHDKLSVMLEELKDSEAKLSGLLNRMDSTEYRIDSLLTNLDVDQPCNETGDSRRMQKFNRIVNENYGPIMCVSNMGNNSVEADEELTRRSEESKRTIEALQKRKQDLLKLQEQAKKQLQEAQLEQSRLVARASSLNQELNSNKTMNLNVQQLAQRLKAVQQIYSTRNQINDSLAESNRTNRDESDHPEDQLEMSDAETDFQTVADKMEELNAMKAQLSQIQKIMSSINGAQNGEVSPRRRESGDNSKEQINQNSLNSSGTDTELAEGNGNNNVVKLELAKSKLNHLTHLLELVQSAQNTTGLPPSYLQLVTNMINDEANSSNPSPSPNESVKSPQRNREEISMETMQVMTRELEERTAAMREERDRLVAARHELQCAAKKHPIRKADDVNLSAEDDSENEEAGLKPATLDSNASRDLLNGSIISGADQPASCNESLYLCRTTPSRSKQPALWNPTSSSTVQERRCKNEVLSRGSCQSSRACSRSIPRDQPSRWSPSPSVSVCNDRVNSAAQKTQCQLELTGNLCELMLSESLQRDINPRQISLQEMFNQHQLLTRTVAQCSHLLWLQQKQIIELRNAFMLQCGGYLNSQWQHFVSAPSQMNFSSSNNPSYPGISNPMFSSLNHVPLVGVQQQQNYNPVNHNQKLNATDLHNGPISLQDIPDQFLHGGNQTTLPFVTPELFGFDMRLENFSRANPPNSNTNINVNQNISSGSNNRVPNGMNCIGSEDSGALNNQVPPGNRANNYWDNFRSYSRQNLLSNAKSNEDTDTSRRSLVATGQERPPRDACGPSFPQNNQSAASGSAQQNISNQGNLELFGNDQYLLPPNQNIRVNQQSQVTRSRSVEPQNPRNAGKNESRNQDNDTRNINVAGKNEVSSGARTRNPESASENLRNVRNDVSHNRNTDNLNSSRNFGRDFDNEEVTRGNNKRLERTRTRNEGRENLNNRGNNTALWENIYSEVSNFIRANESRPYFLIQLFRGLQQVGTDNLRQRTLESIQEIVNANNRTERASNSNGGNLNVIENRNNIRENRSNLNRNQSEEPNRIDELFCHLRENQNTIRQNIGMSSFVFGGNNLENPNISNIRNLSNSRNNLENEGLRDLRTYFEANLCNFGHNSTLENPNLSNIRENLTRRGPTMSDVENINPKNVYLSMYDNTAVQMRRRNQRTSMAPDFDSSIRNFEVGNEYASNEFPANNESVRTSNNHFELDNFEESTARGGDHFQQDHRSLPLRYPILDGDDYFIDSRQFLTNGNDSGIDINFNNDERKRMFVEDETLGSDVTVKVKKNEAGDVEEAAEFVLSQWDRNEARETSFDSPLSLPRNEISSSFIPVYDSSFCLCRTFQQVDNGDLAEADQSRNDETSGAESDSGFVNLHAAEPETGCTSDQNPQNSDNVFSSQNFPESERNLPSQNESNVDGASAAEPEGNSGFPNSSEPEGNFSRMNENSEAFCKSDNSESYYCQLNGSSSSENCATKGDVKTRKKLEESVEKETCKNSTNKFRDNSSVQKKFEGTSNENMENHKTDSESAASVADGSHRSESKELVDYGKYQYVVDVTPDEERIITSPEAEAEADWECGSGLDQVPTRLNKSGPSRKLSR